VTKDILKLISDMEETTFAAKGAGIAAPQVGRSERVCITMLGKKLVALINPHITWKSADLVIAEEGCLSLPDIWLQIPRSREIIVKYLDEKGRPQERCLKDLDARVVQHEVDHLEGVLIVDYPRSAPVIPDHLAM
jgi:peptide deformylase